MNFESQIVPLSTNQRPGISLLTNQKFAVVVGGWHDLSKHTVPTSFVGIAVPTKVVGMLVLSALPKKVLGILTDYQSHQIQE